MRESLQHMYTEINTRDFSQKKSIMRASIFRYKNYLYIHDVKSQNVVNDENVGCIANVYKREIEIVNACKCMQTTNMYHIDVTRKFYK